MMPDTQPTSFIAVLQNNARRFWEPGGRGGEGAFVADRSHLQCKVSHSTSCAFRSSFQSCQLEEMKDQHKRSALLVCSLASDIAYLVVKPVAAAFGTACLGFVLHNVAAA